MARRSPSRSRDDGAARLNVILGAQAATILLGLISAAAWGSGDFGGGLLARRTALFGVVLGSQVVGMAVALVVAIGRGETFPTTTDLAWSVLGGIAGGIGIAALYGALAVGRMGTVAPVTGVVTALIPVVAGIVLEGMPGPLVLVGIGLAIAAVVLVSQIRDDEDGPARASGLGLAVLAGVSLGILSVLIAQISDGHAFGPLVLIRGTEVVLIVVVVLFSRSAWRPARPLLPAIAGVGILDMTGNGAFILAVQTGALAVAAVLSSLYTVTTVILAMVFLHERVTRLHAAGIALAATAIACIAAGST
jgi:drug/metabolite transporter (DMT)-like permease